MTLVGMWIKTSKENAMAVLRCSRWQRWFVGIHSSSLRLFHQRKIDQQIDVQSLAAKTTETTIDSNTGEATDAADAATYATGATSTTAEEEELDNTNGRMMTTLVVDALSALYRTLLHDVKRGYEHWSVLHALTRDMPSGTYFCRAVVISTLKRSHQLLSQQVAPLNTAGRRTSLRTSLSMPSHLADNLSATFQFVDELLLGVSPSEWSFVVATSLVTTVKNNTTHPSNLPDLLDDRLTASRIGSVSETSSLECTGSQLVLSMLLVAHHMRRCGVLTYKSSKRNSTYPPSSSSSSSTSLSSTSTFSKCLSWRLAPIVRVVLAVMESSGVTTTEARDASLQFLQSLVSNELSTGIIGVEETTETTETLQKKEHARQAVLRILNGLGRCMFSEDVILNDLSREAHGVMLIAIANNHDCSPPGQEGFFTPEMMRPQGNENAVTTSHRILAILEDVLRTVQVGRGGGELPMTPACLR